MDESQQENRPGWSSTHLVQRLAAGDEDAFSYIYKTYWQRLFMAAYRKTKSKETAEELVQNLFVTLWRRRGEQRIQELENYLFTCVKNAVIKQYEAQLAEQRYFDYQKNLPAGYDCLTEETVSLNELTSALQSSLAKLPQKSQEIFRMSRFEDRSTQEIAVELNISEKTVEYHLTKSKKLLRHLLRGFTAPLVLLAFCWLW